MPTLDRPTSYTGTAKALHWLLAVSLIGLIAFGWYMTGLPISPTKLKFYNWHKWAGITILVLSVARLLWRLTHRPPALPDAMQAAMPAWQRVAHHGVHHLMYALFFLVPLMGWAMSSAAGFPVVWFGVLELPDFVAKNPELAEVLKPWHGRLAWLLTALIVLHVAAVIKHQLIDRDGLLGRMLPGR
ncbi:cytochrome b [Comamonas serinivorans]|uniref:Cytochrome b n=1 Tax=Comamonas serinivorans TaxID=1082851 RepID=A0A1Y0ENX4_9BURK|nr:cytochrome b [Comamonas serinivorans]ARU05327.1 cytochrome b [Comamonas serinivorans]